MGQALYTRHCPTVAFLTSESKGPNLWVGATCPSLLGFKLSTSESLDDDIPTRTASESVFYHTICRLKN